MANALTGQPGLSLDRRKVLLGLGMAAVAGFAQARQPVINTEPLEEGELVGLMPERMGRWTFMTESGLVLPPSDALSDRLYDNLVTRIYTNPEGKAAMFLMAYNNSQDGVLQIHRPETCYPAGGFVLSETQPMNVALPSASGPASGGLPAQVFSADSRTRDEVVLYWTRVGEEFPQRWSQQRLTVAQDNIRGIIPDGMLARVSTLGSDIGAELPVLEDFVVALHNEAPPKLRGLLFGA
ncbi:exosortase-associated protein EpsI, V-type [Erythrobacter sp. W53]|uniref:exosortase-associated protein EpsI, V-type n=1 Tax=Erythrobacter sp. W53 TaxID=3425947 RepID=UPI003D7686A4